MIDSVFVYGTLCRGQSRAHCWPKTARAVAECFVRGSLYDLGPYPAMLAGDDIVRGECWQLWSPDMEVTLCVLDAIEGYAQPNAPNLYQRKVVPVFASPTGERAPLRHAYCYFLVPKLLPASARRIHPRPYPTGTSTSRKAGGAYQCAYWPSDEWVTEETASLPDPFDPAE